MRRHLIRQQRRQVQEEQRVDQILARLAPQVLQRCQLLINQLLIHI